MIALAALALVVALPKPISGDFDFDGRKDVARVIRRGDRLDVEIVRGATNTATIVDASPSARGDLYLTKIKRGRLETWCGKGGGEDGDPCPYKFLQLKGETVAFGTPEASMAVAFWNGMAFEVVWISD